MTAYLSELTIAHGSATVGGGILNAGSLTIESGTVIEDNAADAGAGIYNFGGSLQIDGAVISGNVAGSGGGGAIYDTSGGSVAITGSTISGNKADYGGGIYLRGGSVTLLDTSIANNTALFDGGGMMNIGGSVKIAGGSLTGNLADGTGSTSGGGAFYNQVNYSSSSAGGTLTITGTTISANRAVSGGGGIFVYSGALTLNYSTLAGNSAGGEGGGILNYNPADQGFSANSTATATLVGTTFSGNTAADGGAIENDDTLSFTNTTIADNSAIDGAGIDDAGTLTGVNATIAYNTVTIGGSGGGLNVEAGGDAMFRSPVVVALVATGQMGQPLAEKRLLIGRRNERIDDDVIDEVRAHRTRIAKVVDLDRRRPAGDDRGPDIAGETVEIDKDINAIVVDRAGGVGIGHGYDINEPVERGGDPGPHWTAIVGAERIAEDFKLAPVVAFDEPRDQVGTRIFTELPGHVADADPLARGGVRRQETRRRPAGRTWPRPLGRRPISPQASSPSRAA